MPGKTKAFTTDGQNRDLKLIKPLGPLQSIHEQTTKVFGQFPKRGRKLTVQGASLLATKESSKIKSKDHNRSINPPLVRERATEHV